MSTSAMNMSALSVDKLVELLSTMYIRTIKAGLSPKNCVSVMLHGQPGVGKSMAICEIAKEIEDQTGKKVNITDLRLLLFNPVDLHGLPTSNADKTMAVWLKPSIFAMDESEDVINILFLDEITACSPQVSASAYSLVLDHKIAEFELPDNCFVICAGNRISDKAVSYKMSTALANRMCHIEVVSSFDSFKDFAIRSGVNEKVIGFLSFRPDYLNTFDPKNDSIAFATPRTWCMVSDILNTVDSEPENVMPLISGLVGGGIAMEFAHWCKIYHKLPNIEDIFAGRPTGSIPTQPDQLFALCSAMIAYAREHKKEYTLIGNSIYYAQAFPADFTFLLLRSYMSIEKGYLEKLKKVPEFMDFVQKKGAILNGATY